MNERLECRHLDRCPGCPLGTKPYIRQLAEKRRRLVEALRLYPHLGIPEIPHVRPAIRTTGYRHRAKLPLRRGPDRMIAGLVQRQSGEILDTPDCPVLAEGLRQAMDVLLVELHDRRGVHSIDIRVSDATGQVQLVLACEGGILHGGKGYAEKLIRKVPGLVSVAVSTADPTRRRVLGRVPEHLAGTAHIDEAIGETQYHLLAGAFFQVDPSNAHQLHSLVRELASGASTILDLYSGVGAYALALAPGRDRVLAVEEIPQAAAAARALAPRNVTVINKPVERVNLREPVDLAILNPSRSGSDPRVLMRIANLADRIVLVECGPEALARDLDVLGAQGFRIDRIEALDLFPQTAEVETVVHLVPGNPTRTWAVPGGRAGGPWRGGPSGAVGRGTEAIALVVGDPGGSGKIGRSYFERIGIVATHGLIKIDLQGPVDDALRGLARRGHPTAGFDSRTADFFAKKAGLQRPFVHITRAGNVVAPLHGDLVQALRFLRAPKPIVERLRTLR